jgi:hypothetical protein
MWAAAARPAVGTRQAQRVEVITYNVWRVIRIYYNLYIVVRARRRPREVHRTLPNDLTRHRQAQRVAASHYVPCCLRRAGWAPVLAPPSALGSRDLF